MTDETKLDVLIRVEPGSLGPDGAEHVERFCKLAQQVMQKTQGANYMWEIVPRYDKSLPELTYYLNSKRLSHEMAEQWLEGLGTSLDEMEEASMQAISDLIDRYLGHKY